MSVLVTLYVNVGKPDSHVSEHLSGAQHLQPSGGSRLMAAPWHRWMRPAYIEEMSAY